jgi:hypothetical protein
MKNKMSVFKPVALVILISFVLMLSTFAFADINLRVLQMAEKIQRLLDGKFIPGYHLVGSNNIKAKGGGTFKGDATVARFYFTKPFAEYTKLKSANKLMTTDDTQLLVYVDIYETPADALKNAASANLVEGGFSGEVIGQKTWSGARAKKTVQDVKKEEEEKKNKENKPATPTADDKKTKGKPTPKVTPKPSPTPKKVLTPAQQRAKAKEDKAAQIEQEKKDNELAKQLDMDPNNYYLKTLVVIKKNCQIHISAINYKKEPDPALMENIAKKLAAKM